MATILIKGIIQEPNKTNKIMNLDLHKIKSLTFITIVFIIFSTICAGILFVLVYSKELFIQTDTLKLLLLSFAITSPFWILDVLTKIGEKVKGVILHP